MQADLFVGEAQLSHDSIIWLALDLIVEAEHGANGDIQVGWAPELPLVHAHHVRQRTRLGKERLAKHGLCHVAPPAPRYSRARDLLGVCIAGKSAGSARQMTECSSSPARPCGWVPAEAWWALARQVERDVERRGLGDVADEDGGGEVHHARACQSLRLDCKTTRANMVRPDICAHARHTHCLPALAALWSGVPVTCVLFCVRLNMTCGHVKEVDVLGPRKTARSMLITSAALDVRAPRH